MSRAYLHAGAKRWEKDDERIRQWWNTYNAALTGLAAADGVTIGDASNAAIKIADKTHGTIEEGVEK